MRARAWSRTARRLRKFVPADRADAVLSELLDDYTDKVRQVGRFRAGLWLRTESRSLVRAYQKRDDSNAGGIAAQWFANARRDAGFTFRMLARSPGFAVAAILMLAMGTGANAAIFSVIDAVLLRPGALDPARLVEVNEQTPGRPAKPGAPFAHVAVLARAPAFAEVAGMSNALPILTGAGAPHRLDVDCVSASFFPLMGVAPVVGRVFAAAEDRPGADAVVVLSFLEWQRDFGGDRGVLGRVISLGGRTNTVVGVMPAGFLGPRVRNGIGAWAPLGQSIGQAGPAGCDDGTNVVEVVARVRAPLTLDVAAAEVNGSGLLTNVRSRWGVAHPSLVLSPADDRAVGALRTPLAMLLGAVGCVLLIACANVANLQLERLLGRRRELAVRLALGATRSRLVRQTLVENLIVSALGALVGFLIARLTIGALVGLMPASMAHVADVAVNGRTFAVTIAVALVSGFAIGALPALQATRTDLIRDLRQSSRAITREATWIRQGLIVAEVGLSLVLLVAAGLLVRTFLILKPADPGFAIDNRTVVEIEFNGVWQPNTAHEQTVETILARTQALPGVASVSMSSYLPLSGATDLSGVTVGDVTANVWASWSSPNYFREMGMRLIRGRFFADSDTASAPAIAVVNEAMAKRFWPSTDPIGQAIDIHAPDRTVSRRRIVGIIGTARSSGTDLEQRSELFVPYRQQPGSTQIYFVIHTNGAPAATLASSVRTIVAEAQPDEVVDSVESIAAKLDRSLAGPRFAMWLFGLFAAAGAALSALGLAAVVAWSVTERRREIGVRMALGASAERVARVIAREGLLLVALGLALGLGLALLSTHLLKNWLYGVAAPTDLRTFVASGLGLLVVTALATYLPARRAARIDPSVTLRSE